MRTSEEIFSHTQEQEEIIQDFLKQGRRDVPTFLEEGAADIIYVPIEDGELRVFYHKPKNSKTKRPVLFVPGYVAAPITWVDFHIPHQGFGEYYYLETREKRSSRIKKTRKTSMSVNQTAKDLGQVIENLGLKSKDFVLFGSSYGSSVILEGLIHGYFTAPTIVIHDPIIKWIWERSINNVALRVVPKFILSALRMPLAHLFTMGMKNKTNKERMIEFARGIVPWKFKRVTLENNKMNLFEGLKKIKEEVFFTTGPLDRYHPRIAYYNYAKEIPKGRLIFMNTFYSERQLITGIIGTEFVKVLKDDGIPKTIDQFEIALER